MNQAGTWTLRDQAGTTYATITEVVQRGNTYFGALAALESYARIKPYFDGMAEYLESHGTPPNAAVLASVAALGLCLQGPDGTVHAYKELQIMDGLVSFALGA